MNREKERERVIKNIDDDVFYYYYSWHNIQNIFLLIFLLFLSLSLDFLLQSMPSNCALILCSAYPFTFCYITVTHFHLIDIFHFMCEWNNHSERVNHKGLIVWLAINFVSRERERKVHWLFQIINRLQSYFHSSPIQSLIQNPIILTTLIYNQTW